MWSGVRRSWRVAVTPRLALVFLALYSLAGSCGPSRASIGLVVVPDPIPVDFVDPCAGVFAMFPCSATDYLHAKWTVSVSTLNEIGGRGTLDVRVVDAASGAPLSDSADGISGDLEVLLGPRASVALPVEWRRPVPEGGPGRIPPPQFAFLITAQLTDSMGNRVSETVTVRERLPRPWQIF
jgi:hypothetical protein